MINKYRIEIKWAFIFMASLLVWMLFERLLGFHNKHIAYQQYVTMIYMIPAIWIYVLALVEKKIKDYEGTITFKQAFISGMIISVIVTVFSPLSQWIISEIITPHYFENVINFSVESGYYEDLEEAQAYFNLTNYIKQSTVGALISGAITTLIVSYFVKTKPAKA